MSNLRAVDVFTPSAFPSFTYVTREDEKLERRLRDALATPGEVVSVSGPSKSGKTVLVEKVVGRDDLITVTGAGVRSADEVWNRVLDWMDVPSTRSEERSVGASGDVSAGAKGELGIPLVAKGVVEGGVTVGASTGKATAESRARRGMLQVVDEIADSGLVLLIDDFHYMNRDIQVEVAKQIKEAARQRVKICTASVPHRADDVVRGNPELRGRVRAVDLDYWKPKDLRSIPELGFPQLNMNVGADALKVFATEASGSPQLMQAMCLQTCFEFGVLEKIEEPTDLSVDKSRIKRILEETSTRTDFSSLVRDMHYGPKTRGTERKEFALRDGTHGDVYRAVLLAVAADPPRLSFPYNELSRRIQAVCSGETPQSASVYTACAQMAKMALAMYPDQRVLEWGDSDILDIVDPYFLFYLRWSGKLETLGRQTGAG